MASENRGSIEQFRLKPPQNSSNGVAQAINSHHIDRINQHIGREIDTFHNSHHTNNHCGRQMIPHQIHLPDFIPNFEMHQGSFSCLPNKPCLPQMQKHQQCNQSVPAYVDYQEQKVKNEMVPNFQSTNVSQENRTYESEQIISAQHDMIGFSDQHINQMMISDELTSSFQKNHHSEEQYHATRGVNQQTPDNMPHVQILKNPFKQTQSKNKSAESQPQSFPTIIHPTFPLSFANYTQTVCRPKQQVVGSVVDKTLPKEFSDEGKNIAVGISDVSSNMLKQFCSIQNSTKANDNIIKSLLNTKIQKNIVKSVEIKGKNTTASRNKIVLIPRKKVTFRRNIFLPDKKKVTTLTDNDLDYIDQQKNTDDVNSTLSLETHARPIYTYDILNSLGVDLCSSKTNQVESIKHESQQAETLKSSQDKSLKPAACGPNQLDDQQMCTENQSKTTCSSDEIAVLNVFSLQPAFDCSQETTASTKNLDFSTSLHGPFHHLSKKSFLFCGVNGCIFSTDMPIELDLHLFEAHRECSHFVCVHCGWVAVKYNLLFNHMLGHINKGSEMDQFGGQCCHLHCEYKPDKFKNYVKHLLCKRHDFENIHQCYICKDIFPTGIQLITHLKTNMLQIIQCPHCSAVHLSKIHISRHIVQNHPGCSQSVRVYKTILCQERKKHNWPHSLKENYLKDTFSYLHNSHLMTEEKQKPKELRYSGLCKSISNTRKTGKRNDQKSTLIMEQCEKSLLKTSEPNNLMPTLTAILCADTSRSKTVGSGKKNLNEQNGGRISKQTNTKLSNRKSKRARIKKRIMTCKECGLVTSHCRFMYKHIRQYHGITEMVICELCKISLSTNKITDHHKQLHIDEDEDYIPTALSEAFKTVWKITEQPQHGNVIKKHSKSIFKKKPILERNIIDKITETTMDDDDDDDDNDKQSFDQTDTESFNKANLGRSDTPPPHSQSRLHSISDDGSNKVEKTLKRRSEIIHCCKRYSERNPDGTFKKKTETSCEEGSKKAKTSARKLKNKLQEFFFTELLTTQKDFSALPAENTTSKVRSLCLKVNAEREEKGSVNLEMSESDKTVSSTDKKNIEKQNNSDDQNKNKTKLQDVEESIHDLKGLTNSKPDNDEKMSKVEKLSITETRGQAQNDAEKNIFQSVKENLKLTPAVNQNKNSSSINATEKETVCGQTAEKPLKDSKTRLEKTKYSNLLGNKELIVKLTKTEIPVSILDEKNETSVNNARSSEIRKYVSTSEDCHTDNNYFINPDFEFRCKYCTCRCGTYAEFLHHLYYHFHYKKYACSYCLLKSFSHNQIVTHVSQVHPDHVMTPNVIIRNDPKKEKRCLDTCLNCFVPKRHKDVQLKEQIAKKKLKPLKKNLLEPQLKSKVSLGVKKELSKSSKNNTSVTSKFPKHQKQMYLCPYCRENKPLMTWTQLHVEICFHIHYKPLRCNYCNLQTSSILYLTRHSKKEHPGKEVKCFSVPDKRKEDKFKALISDSVMLSKKYRKIKNKETKHKNHLLLTNTQNNQQTFTGDSFKNSCDSSTKDKNQQHSELDENKETENKPILTYKERLLKTKLQNDLQCYKVQIPSQKIDHLTKYRLYKTHELFTTIRDGYGDPVYICKKCNYTIRNLKFMCTHSYKHQPQIFKCTYCDFKAFPRSYVVLHLKSKHPGKEHNITDMRKQAKK